MCVSRVKLSARCGAVLAAILFAGTPAVTGQSPRVDRVERSGGQRGTEFEIRCFGERLNQVDGVLLYRPGLSLVAVSSETPDQCRVRLLSSADCPLGEHPLRLTGPTGVSDLRTVQIGPYPHTVEAEPNNRVEAAQPLDLGITVHGLIEQGDIDLYRVPLRKGQRLSAEVVGLRLGGFLFDPWLAVRDADGNLLAESDDTALLHQDPLLSILAPADGDYFVQIREAAFGGDLDSAYQLHIGEHPRPVVAYPPGGMPGEEITVQLNGDAAGPTVATIRVPEGSTGEFSWFPEDVHGMAPSPIRLRASRVPNVMEREPNDGGASATPTILTPGFALNGILEKPGDRDVFRFRAGAGDEFLVSTWASRIGSPLDTVVTIAAADGRELVRNDDGAVHDSRLRFIAPADGDYLITISDHLDRGGPDHVYRAEFLAVEPSLHLTLPVSSERRPQQQQKIELAPGARAALLVTARRTGFHGEVQLNPTSLPPGVTARTAVIEPDSHLACIVFEAAADASPSQTLIGITGVGQAGDQSVPADFSVPTGLVFGPPRRTIYHAVDVDRIPLVVTQSAPFSLEVSPPRSPLVRDGRLEIPVRVTRSPRATGDITLTLPFLPPWIELPEGGVTIPEGENEIVFPLTSTSAADARTWNLVVQGETSIDGESVFVASAPFDVRVTDPYLDLAVSPAVTEQGESTELRCDLKWNRPVQGQVTVEVRGLPKDVSVDPLTISPSAESCVFPVRVGDETPPAIHNTLYVEVTVDDGVQPVTHYLGRGGVLEVFARGARASDPRSRLEVLRELAGSRRSPDADQSTESVGSGG